MNKNLTDIHQHLLWGIDDGPRKPEAMYKMLRKAARQGITRIAATPHARPGFMPFNMDLYCERLAEARDYCKANNLPIQILPGAEVEWTYQTISALRQGAAPTLGGTDFVLLELPWSISINHARDAVREMMGAGYRPVLAHVERYRCFCGSPREALKFREQTGALFQMNASTLIHSKGFMQRRFADVMLMEYGIDAIATDAHGNPERPVNLRDAYEWLLENTDEDYADDLTNFFGVHR
jgi:protein-tyrosine phosphatase